MNRRKQGTFYEQATKEFLCQNGVEILEMNYRCRIGEIDIIGKDAECLVFFEVKYRKNVDFGSPFEAITKKKQNTIIKVANYYLMNSEYKGLCRFDCIGICGDKIEWLKNAFC